MMIERIYKDMVEQSQDCLLNAIENIKEQNISFVHALKLSEDERLNTIKRAAYFYFAMFSVFQEKP